MPLTAANMRPTTLAGLAACHAEGNGTGPVTIHLSETEPSLN